MRIDRLAVSAMVMVVLTAIPAVARAQDWRRDDVERRIQREWDRRDREDARAQRLAEVRVDREIAARVRSEVRAAERARDVRESQLRLRDQQEWNRQRAIERQIDRELRDHQRREDAAFRRELRIRDRYPR